MQPDNNSKIYKKISFIPGLTDNSNLSPIFHNTNTAFAHSTQENLKKIFSNTKTKIKTQEQHNVVYQIPCKGDTEGKCEEVYIGCTKRQLETRLGEHKNDISKHKQTTALSQHMINKKHTADFANAIILDKERRCNRRYTLETLRIQQNITKTMNFKEDKDKIHVAYAVAI